MTTLRTKILTHFSRFDRLNMVCLSKRCLHKWPQNRLFLPAPPAKQVFHHFASLKSRNSLRNCDLVIACLSGRCSNNIKHFQYVMSGDNQTTDVLELIQH